MPTARKLTVLVPCKNEVHNIRECLASVRGIADDILVADSLFTDDTLDVVRRTGGCRIIQREFIDYASFKNWAIPQASHPWVLLVDADERLTPELASEIRGTVDRDDPSRDAYGVRATIFSSAVRSGTAAGTIMRRSGCFAATPAATAPPGSTSNWMCGPARWERSGAGSSTIRAALWRSGRKSRTATRPSGPKTNTPPAAARAGWESSSDPWCLFPGLLLSSRLPRRHRRFDLLPKWHVLHVPQVRQTLAPEPRCPTMIAP